MGKGKELMGRENVAYRDPGFTEVRCVQSASRDIHGLNPLCEPVCSEALGQMLRLLHRSHLYWNDMFVNCAWDFRVA